ncbi:aldolase/citrate lyase family protein [Halomontanus rarus]|uniref:aldolase/citrate lyase family protein n=1 Tax=Halomontanus rarus TaxID=3034020 RepID=UPI001A98AF9B
MLSSNETLRKLESGSAVDGAWLLSGSARTAEVIARTGVDWIGIDTEHSPYSPEHVEALVRAVEPDATPLVRLPSVQTAISGGAKHALDSGARGVIVPNVETAADARRVVRATYVPPDGERGIAGTTRANVYGEAFDEYVAGVNDETLVAVQIESPAAVERIEEILAVEGIDVVFVGENDLSSAVGRPGETDHPAVTTVVDRVLEVAREADVYPGIAGRTPVTRAERAERGFRFFLIGADLTFVRRGVAEFLSE